MGILGDACLSATQSNDIQTAVKIVEFLNTIVSMPNADREIENAVTNSFSPVVTLRESQAGKQLLDKMPERIRRAVEAGEAI